MNLKCVLFFFVITFLSSTVNTEEIEYKNLGNYESWSVYSKKNKELCYMLSKPYKSLGKYNIRGTVRVLAARRPLESNKNSIVIDFGYPFSEGAKAKIEIDNKKTFEIDTFNQTAWTNSKDNPNLDNKIIKEMQKGLELKMIGKSKKGTVTYDFYSLRGFTKGFKKMKDYCG